MLYTNPWHFTVFEYTSYNNRTAVSDVFGMSGINKMSDSASLLIKECTVEGMEGGFSIHYQMDGWVDRQIALA